jgi:DNA-binding response OmpR family regulator
MVEKRSILLVEDDFYIRDIYQIALNGEGFEVIEAEDGEQAIALYDSQPFDLVLLDIMLPKVSGVQVLSYIRSRAACGKKVPVIVFTNVGDNKLKQEIARYKPEEYLIKSAINIRDCVSMIKRMVA